MYLGYQLDAYTCVTPHGKQYLHGVLLLLLWKRIKPSMT